MEITLRDAIDGDREFGRRVHHLAYREVVERQYGPWDETVQDQFFDDNWAVLGLIQIVLCDGEPCGYYIEETRMSGWLDIREIVLLPVFQGRGIGTRLLRETMARAARAGLPVWLQTHLQNRAAGLYRRLGFRETERDASHIQFEWVPPEVAAPEPHVRF